MNVRKFLIVTIAVAVPAFLLAPAAPLGHLIWPSPVMLDPAPNGPQQGLFILLGLITAIAFGAAIGFLMYGFPAVRNLMGAHSGMAAIVHGATFWMLGNWWLHDSLHMIVGLHAGGLLAIEYGFHVTLMIAAGILVYAFVRLGSQRTSVGQQIEPSSALNAP